MFGPIPVPRGQFDTTVIEGWAGQPGTLSASQVTRQPGEL
uniref:Uncharacterized protein n=1 Tax=Anguilla anguilla TaxID=7936 RepID=A0A0E9SY63_ANGAN